MTLVYQPLENIMAFLVHILPGASVGLAIIIVTVTVKIVLFPLTLKSTRVQRKMREIQPEITAIKERYPEDRAEQSKQTIELYQKHQVNPFSGCFPTLIQIPIIFGLYFVFWKGLQFDQTILYSFVSMPVNPNYLFLGIFPLFGKSIILSLLAGVTQYFQISLAMPKIDEKPKDKPSFQDDFARSMQLQMRYLFPVMMGFFAYATSSAVALYWLTSNCVSILQELYVQRGVKS